MNRIAGTAMLLASTLIASCDAMAQPAGRYTLVEDGNAVVGRKTGLVWKRWQEGKQWDGRFCKGIGKELGREDARRASSGAWRLPSVNELKSLTGPANSDGATIDGAAFPDTDPGIFWSSSPSDNDPTAAWTVDFEKGFAFNAEIWGQMYFLVNGHAARPRFLNVVAKDGLSDGRTGVSLGPGS